MAMMTLIDRLAIVVVIAARRESLFDWIAIVVLLLLVLNHCFDGSAELIAVLD